MNAWHFLERWILNWIHLDVIYVILSMSWGFKSPIKVKINRLAIGFLFELGMTYCMRRGDDRWSKTITEWWPRIECILEIFEFECIYFRNRNVCILVKIVVTSVKPWWMVQTEGDLYLAVGDDDESVHSNPLPACLVFCSVRFRNWKVILSSDTKIC